MTTTSIMQAPPVERTQRRGISFDANATPRTPSRTTDAEQQSRISSARGNFTLPRTTFPEPSGSFEVELRAVPADVAASFAGHPAQDCVGGREQVIPAYVPQQKQGSFSKATHRRSSSRAAESMVAEPGGPSPVNVGSDGVLPTSAASRLKGRPDSPMFAVKSPTRALPPVPSFGGTSHTPMPPAPPAFAGATPPSQPPPPPPPPSLNRDRSSFADSYNLASASLLPREYPDNAGASLATHSTKPVSAEVSFSRYPSIFSVEVVSWYKQSRNSKELRLLLRSVTASHKWPSWSVQYLWGILVAFSSLPHLTTCFRSIPYMYCGSLPIGNVTARSARRARCRYSEEGRIAGEHLAEKIRVCHAVAKSSAAGCGGR